MKIFIDTANTDQIRDAAAMGVVDGVTTNPSLVAKSGRSYREVVEEICDIVDGPISAEVIATETDAILAEARDVASWHPNVVVKVPLIADGLKAVRTLTDDTELDGQHPTQRGVRVVSEIVAAVASGHHEGTTLLLDEVRDVSEQLV